LQAKEDAMHDVIIVGARVAGSATALLLARTATGDLWFPHVYPPNQNPADPRRVQRVWPVGLRRLVLPRQTVLVCAPLWCYPSSIEIVSDKLQSHDNSLTSKKHASRYHFFDKRLISDHHWILGKYWGLN